MRVTKRTQIHGFADKAAIFQHFDIAEPTDGTLLFAEYDTGDYEGSAFVLFRLDGKLFEVNASHCSCMGLEGQWEPTECTLASLKMRKFYSQPAAAKFVEDLK